MFDTLTYGNKIPFDTEPGTISREDYEEWQRSYTFDALRGLTPGQSFCQHFRVRDFRLWFGGDQTATEQIVEREYLR